MAAGLPSLDPVKEEHGPAVKAATGKLKAAEKKLETAPEGEARSKAEAGVKEARDNLKTARKPIADTIDHKRGQMQRWQEIGGLTGRIIFAILLLYVASRLLT